MGKLPKSIIKKYGITKKAWRVFRGQKGGKGKGKTRGGGGRTTGRARSFLSTQTVFKYLRIAALLGPAGARLMERSTGEQKIRRILLDYTGFNMVDGSWNWSRLARGWLPYVATCLITYGVSKLNGIIRRL